MLFIVVLNFNMNKIETTLLGLLNMLPQAEKTILKEKPSIHLVSWKKWSFKKKKKTKKDKKDEFIKGTKRMSKGHAITVENQGIEGVIAKSTLNPSKGRK